MDTADGECLKEGRSLQRSSTPTNSAVISHTIQNLETFTQYLVSVQVFNPEGPGPNATVLVMTDEGGNIFKMDGGIGESLSSLKITLQRLTTFDYNVGECQLRSLTSNSRGERKVLENY
ncbi:hypothetical protein RUM44_006571 [Polyplax serrata]|uniref:Fibronectin type-III domain-containing protein n=1 Tax=Polyplax serrata TaxID=468196 RepID=A0ABR1AJ75_POLSC